MRTTISSFLLGFLLLTPPAAADPGKSTAAVNAKAGSVLSAARALGSSIVDGVRGAYARAPFHHNSKMELEKVTPNGYTVKAFAEGERRNTASWDAAGRRGRVSTTERANETTHNPQPMVSQHTIEVRPGRASYRAHSTSSFYSSPWVFEENSRRERAVAATAADGTRTRLRVVRGSSRNRRDTLVTREREIQRERPLGAGFSLVTLRSDSTKPKLDNGVRETNRQERGWTLKWRGRTVFGSKKSVKVETSTNVLDQLESRAVTRRRTLRLGRRHQKVRDRTQYWFRGSSKPMPRVRRLK